MASVAPTKKPNPGKRSRGQGEGTIYKRVDRRTRKDGTVVERERWLAMVDLGVEGGKRVRKVLYGRTRAEVAQKLTTVLADRSRGIEPKVDRDHVTLEAWLHAWLENVIRRTRRPNTYTLYEETVRRHIVPILGRKRPAALRRKDVDDWIRNRGKTNLAPRTIHRLLAVLHSALEHAIRTERLALNPASKPSLPRVEKQEPRTLPREHCRPAA